MNAVFNVLCDSTVKGALVLAAAYLATSLLRRRLAALRHALWAAALACLLVIPLISVLSPPVQLPILPAHSSDAFSIEIVSQINSVDTIDAREPLRQTPSVPVDRPDIAPQHPVEAAHPPVAFAASAAVPREAAVPVVPMTSKKNSLSWKDWAAVMWLAVAAIILARLCLGQILLVLCARRATIIADGALGSLLAGVCERIGLHRPVRLVGGSELMPMTWGIWRPIILLPTDAERWTPEKQLIVLLHEAGHIKRLDCLWQMIGQMAAAIFWINPLAWLAVMKLRAEAERACDDLVLSTGQRPSAYAEQLLDIVRAARNKHRGLANIGAVAMARPSRLQSRVRAILDLRHRRTQITRRFAAIASVIALILVVPLAVVRLSERSLAQTAPAQGALSQNAVPGPSSRPATQSDSVWDGFVSIQWDRSNDGGMIPMAVHAGLLEADGRMNVRGLKSDQLLPGIISHGVRNGEVFLEHTGSDPGSDLAMNLRTGQVREIGKIEKIVPDLTWTSLPEMLQWHGDMHVVWRRSGSNASYPILFSLSIENKRTGANDNIVDDLPYSEIAHPTEGNGIPPTVWLDDDHLLTIRDGQPNLNDHRGATYQLIVVDIRAKNVRELGTLPWGTDADIVEPRGLNGDAAVLANGKTFAISAADAINGQGRLEQRPIKWGAFTLSWTHDLLDERFFGMRGEDGSIHADTLDLDDKRLGTDVEVSVSPDGKRAIWREKHSSGNIDGEILYYCDSVTKIVQRIASADALTMPIWATRQQMTGSAIQAPDATTKPSAQVLNLVHQLSDNSFEIRQSAQNKLVGLGPDIEPQLQQLLSGDLPEEVRLRISTVISSLRLLPSVITLHYTDAPMMDVLEDFARQAGNDMGIHRPQVSDYARSHRFSIDVDHVSFWEALRKIEEASDIRSNSVGSVALSGRRLMLSAIEHPVTDDPNILGGPAKASGAFLVTPSHLLQTHGILIGNPRPMAVYMGMDLSVFAEPKMRILCPLEGGSLNPITDDNGNVLAALSSNQLLRYTWQYVIGGGIELKMPPNLGKKIPRVQGELHFSVETNAEILEFNDFSKVKNITRQFVGVPVTLSSLTKDDNGWNLTIESPGIQMDPIGNDSGIMTKSRIFFHELSSSIELLDEAGNAILEGGGSSMVGGETRMHFGSFNPRGTLPNAKVLRWDVPTQIQPVSIAIDMHDLDLPIGRAMAPAALQNAAPIKTSVVTKVGAIDISTTKTNLSRFINYGQVQEKGTHVMVWVYAKWNKDICILDAQPQRWVRESVDENGAALQLLNKTDLVRDSAYPSEYEMAQMTGLELLTELIAPDNVGHRIANLRGELQTTIQSKSQLVEFPSIAANQSKSFGDNSVKIKNVEILSDGASETFDIEITGPVTGQSLTVLHGIIGQMKFYQADGSPCKLGLYKETGGATPPDSKTDKPYEVLLRTDKPAAGLRWQAPLEISPLTIPFELHDIPLGN